MSRLVYLIFIFILGASSFLCVKLDPDRFKSPHYKDSRFRNIVPDSDMFEENSLLTNPKEKFFKYKEMLLANNEAVLIGQGDEREGVPNIGKLQTEDLLAKPGQLRTVWLGHATNWIAAKHKGRSIHIITDPIFGDVNWAHQRIVKFPIEPKHLPPIDVVLVSHAHPDHLDIDSLQKIQKQNPKVRIFFPEGNRAFAKDNGIDRAEIVKWWQNIKIKNVAQITFTPSHHWARMALNDKSQSHWGSYVIKIGKRQIFFSGDTGYSTHFKKIAEKYPSGFDAALIEIRYQAYWSTRRSHLSPEEAIQVSKELKARLLLPIHWGTFPSNHSTPLGAVTLLERLLMKEKTQVKALLWHPGHPGVTFKL